MRLSAWMLSPVVGLTLPCSGGAVVWEASEGGNGHLYEVLTMEATVTWSEARSLALAAGGDLASIESPAENEFVFELSLATEGGWTYWGPWLGGQQADDAGAADLGWSWCDGSPWDFTNWAVGEPNDSKCGGGIETRLHFVRLFDGPPADLWNDLNESGECYDDTVRSYVVEWSADCNGDGVVDYGQIVAGQLTDQNGNGVPDCCEAPETCPSDLNREGHVDGADLSILLGYWGLSTESLPFGLDVDCDGVVGGAELAALLGAWGSCP